MPFGRPCATIDAKGLRPAAHAPTMHGQPAADRMNVNGKPCRTIWIDESRLVKIIDQRALPHAWVVGELRTFGDAAVAIRDMHVRGAGLIGATAGYGMALAARDAADAPDPVAFLRDAAAHLKAARPTAVNLAWAVDRVAGHIAGLPPRDAADAAFAEAGRIADEDAAACRAIGLHGLPLIQEVSRKKGGAPVNILTHCNAGWLAFVDYGSATAPIYEAHDRGIAVHVWVDETRPRSQGAKLTAWELGQHGVPHTLVADNTGGHLMQHRMVDLVIVGTDRTTRSGDVANKIGTYLKALAARDNGIPFHVALPSSSFDWTMRDGLREIPIEQRGDEEVKFADGLAGNARVEVLVSPASTPAANFAFDVTPARLVTSLITERGICQPSEDSILSLFPEHSGARPQGAGTCQEA
jgi:methylthioribose-1-phosphate isomerase